MAFTHFLHRANFLSLACWWVSTPRADMEMEYVTFLRSTNKGLDLRDGRCRFISPHLNFRCFIESALIWRICSATQAKIPTPFTRASKSKGWANLPRISGYSSIMGDTLQPCPLITKYCERWQIQAGESATNATRFLFFNFFCLLSFILQLPAPSSSRLPFEFRDS